MQMFSTNCPACGGSYGGRVTSRFLVCEYCGTRFALTDEECAAFGIGAQTNDEPVPDDTDDWEDEGSDESMSEFAQAACEDFLNDRDVDEDDFESSRKIVNGLDVEGDEIYLIHDDTLFKSGKNGFAITDAGIYCRDWGDPRATFTSWEDFADGDEPELDGSNIRQGDACLCYFTSDSKLLGREIFDLYIRLYQHARRVM